MAQEMSSTHTDPGPAVEVHDLARTYGAQRALDGITLTVSRGECLGLLGPNGAGKTTTIRILSTLSRPSSGAVRVLGHDPICNAAEIRARIGVVPQEIALYDGLSARENLAFFGRLQDMSAERIEARVGWALEQAGLADRADDRVETYSGGMKRRLNIVAALLHEPELVFLDEPTVGIDPQSRNHIFEMVESMRRSGTTLIYTTHQLGEVERLCDRIVILDHGRIVAQGTLAELARMGGRAPAQWVKLSMGITSEKGLRVLAESGVAFEVEEEAAGLEEIFLSLTGRALRDGS